MPTMPNESQHQLRDILRELQTGRRLTVAVALSDLGVYALSQRIGELRRLGWPIDRTMIRTRDRKSTRLNSSHIPLSRMPSSA